jgi:hypothetical protein
MMTEDREPSFDTIAMHIAETIDDILTAHRERARRIELIRHHVRRALGIGYKAARGRTLPERSGDPR